MIDNNFHVETRTLIIDLAEIEPGKYEAMVLKKRDSLEVECFRSSDLLESIKEFVRMAEKYAPVKPEAIQEKKTRKAAAKQPVNKYGVKVGDLFYDSWGYEQTNIDFYQVVKLKGTTQIVLKAVRADSRNIGFCSNMVKARKDDFITGDYITHQQHGPEGITRTVSDMGGNGKMRIVAGSGRNLLFMTDWETEYNETSYY